MRFVYFFLKCVVRWSEKSVRFEKSYGNWLPDGPNSIRFYLTVWDMACMLGAHHCAGFAVLLLMYLISNKECLRGMTVRTWVQAKQTAALTVLPSKWCRRNGNTLQTLIRLQHTADPDQTATHGRPWSDCNTLQTLIRLQHTADPDQTATHCRPWSDCNILQTLIRLQHTADPYQTATHCRPWSDCNTLHTLIRLQHTADPYQTAPSGSALFAQT